MTKMTLEKLAGSIKESFSSLEKTVTGGFEKVDKRLTNLEKGQEDIIVKVNRLERGQEDIILRLDRKANDFDLKNLDQRVTKIEKHVGLENK